MKYNPFGVYPYRKQPSRKMRYNQGLNIQPLVNGMVTLGSIAVIGGTTVAILNSMPKG
jgi:hypothetical protein